MKNWWRGDEEVMKNWWRTDEELMKNCWRLPLTTTDCHWLIGSTPLNTQSYLRDGWMDGIYICIPDSTYYKSTASGANKNSLQEFILLKDDKAWRYHERLHSVIVEEEEEEERRRRSVQPMRHLSGSSPFHPKTYLAHLRFPVHQKLIRQGQGNQFFISMKYVKNRKIEIECVQLQQPHYKLAKPISQEQKPEQSGIFLYLAKYVNSARFQILNIIHASASLPEFVFCPSMFCI